MATNNMNVPAAVGTRPDDDEVYGTTCLPAARVKLIVKADPEIAKLSNPATFSLSIAAVCSCAGGKGGLCVNEDRADNVL